MIDKLRYYSSLLSIAAFILLFIGNTKTVFAGWQVSPCGAGETEIEKQTSPDGYITYYNCEPAAPAPAPEPTQPPAAQQPTAVPPTGPASCQYLVGQIKEIQNCSTTPPYGQRWVDVYDNDPTCGHSTLKLRPDDSCTGPSTCQQRCERTYPADSPPLNSCLAGCPPTSPFCQAGKQDFRCLNQCVRPDTGNNCPPGEGAMEIKTCNSQGSDKNTSYTCSTSCHDCPLPTATTAPSFVCDPDNLVGTCPSRGTCQIPISCTENGRNCAYKTEETGKLCYNNAGTLLTCTAYGTCEGPPPTPTLTTRPPVQQLPPRGQAPPGQTAPPPAQAAKCENKIIRNGMSVRVNWDFAGEGCNAKIVDLSEGGEIPLGDACKNDGQDIDVAHLENREIVFATSSSLCGSDLLSEGSPLTLTPASEVTPPGTSPGTGGGDVGACINLKPSETRPSTNGQWPDSSYEWKAFCSENACRTNADCSAHTNPNGTGWCYGFGSSSNDWKCIQLKPKSGGATTPPGAGSGPTATTAPGQPAATSTPTPIPGQPAPTATPTPTPQPPIANLDSSTFEATCQGTTLSFRWRGVIGARKYAIRIDDTSNVWNGSTSNPSPGDTVDDAVPGSSYTKTGATTGKTYTWWVHSVDNADRWSSDVHGPNVTCGSSPTATTVPPTHTPGVGTPTTVPPTVTPSDPTPTLAPLPAEIAQFDLDTNDCIDRRDVELASKGIADGTIFQETFIKILDTYRTTSPALQQYTCEERQKNP